MDASTGVMCETGDANPSKHMIIFCKGVCGFQAFGAFDFVLSFSLIQISLYLCKMHF